MVLTRYNPLLHFTAVATTVATLLLIFMGGLVTSHGAGMSVPDWPNSYGYNMWLFPPSLWWNKGGIFYEHSHRLMGTLVGLFCIIQSLMAWRSEPRRWVRNLAYATLLFCILQGVLGGFRVILVQLNLAILHGVSAQLFFCTAALLAMVTSRWWNRSPNMAWSEDYGSGQRLIGLTWIAFGLVFAQLIVGALMRHNGAGLAIPDLPLAYGQILPPVSADGVQAVNNYRAYQLHMDPVSLTQVWLHMGHRIGAIVATGAIVWLMVKVFRQHSGQRVLTVPAGVLGVLLGTQITLGVYTVLRQKPADIASAHVAVGATVLVCCFMLVVRSMRLYSRRFRVRNDAVLIDVRSIDPKSFLVS
jgi:cytochrome c oxidase assembly protein subunit 15